MSLPYHILAQNLLPT